MLSFTANGFEKITIEAKFDDDTNTWTLASFLDYVEYCARGVVFHHQINSPKTVSKMLKLCGDCITFELSGDVIEVSIEVDYIDDERISLCLEKIQKNYEEVLLKQVRDLSKKIAILENRLKQPQYKCLEGTYSIKIDEKFENMEFKCYCSDPQRQDEFELRVLNLFKAAQISNIQRDISKFITMQSEKKLIKQISKASSVEKLWETVNTFQVEISTEYHDPGHKLGHMSHVTFSFFPRGGEIKYGCTQNPLVVSQWTRDYLCNANFRTSRNEIRMIYGNILEFPKETIFVMDHVEFPYKRVSSPDELFSLPEEELRNLKRTTEGECMYDTFGYIGKEQNFEKNKCIYLWDKP